MDPNEFGSMSDNFFCPITKELFTDPVVTTTGHTYERGAIKHWFTNHNTDPMTGMRLTSRAVFPNHSLRAIIEAWQAQFPSDQSKSRDQKDYQAACELREAELVSKGLLPDPKNPQAYLAPVPAPPAAPRPAKAARPPQPRAPRPPLRRPTPKRRRRILGLTELVYPEDLEEKNREDPDPAWRLFVASGRGDLETVKRLLNRNVTLDRRFPTVVDKLWSPLMLASAMGRHKVVKSLCQAKPPCDVLQFDTRGCSALHLACEKGSNANYLKVIEILLTTGNCPVDIADKMRGDFTPLIMAAINGHYEAVRKLLAHGADPLRKDAFDKTALDWVGAETTEEEAEPTRELLHKHCRKSRSSSIEASLSKTGSPRIDGVLSRSVTATEKSRATAREAVPSPAPKDRRTDDLYEEEEKRDPNMIVPMPNLDQKIGDEESVKAPDEPRESKSIDRRLPTSMKNVPPSVVSAATIGSAAPQNKSAKSSSTRGIARSSSLQRLA